VFTWRDGVKPGNPGLAQDTRGYIWASTPEGPVRYNGQSWQKVEIPGEHTPVGPFSLLAAGDGSLWFGLPEDRLLRLRAGVWRRFDPRSGVPAGIIASLIETVERGRSTVWAGTGSGLGRCRGDTCMEVPALHGQAVHTLAATRAEDGRLALWIGTNHGLLRLDDAGGDHPILSPLFDDPAVLPDRSIRSLAETVGKDGQSSLWVGTDRGLARLRGGVWSRYDAGSGFPPGPVAKLLASRSPDGELIVWAGSFRSGLLRIQDDGRWQAFDSRCGLPANYVYDLLITGSGKDHSSLWLATPAALARLDREQWHAVDTRSGLPNDVVFGVGEATFPDGQHTFWIGTLGGMVRLTPRGWERFSPSPAGSEVIFSATNAQEKDGTVSLWLGTVEGLRRFSHGRWTSFSTHNAPLPHEWIMSLLAVPSPRGAEIWAGTARGLARFAEGRWTVFRPQDSGLPGPEVRALALVPRPAGAPVLWTGTDGGVARLAAERWEAVRVPCLPHPRVMALLPVTVGDGTGWLWIATQGGVARMRLDGAGNLQGPCEALTDHTRPALSNAAVAQVQTDLYGRVYLFTDWGVDRLTLAPTGGLGAARLETFNAGDGLPGMEFNRASYRDRLGRIWGGATGGAAILDPAPPLGAAPRPVAPLLLEHVKVAGRERPLVPGAPLRHDENSLEFQFALLSYRREHAILYRTQLAGLEDEPTPWSREAHVVYNRLPQGTYTFRAWGRDGEGTVSGPIQVDFRVRPAPWLTLWAIALYALTLVGLGWVGNQLRAKARRTAQLEAQVAERTRELAEANRKLELSSVTDPLTGLSNRRFLDLNIGPDLSQAVRNAQQSPALRDHNADLIFYFIDLDHFKRLNDWIGHAGGDTVLVELGHRLRQVARTTDATVRWGGEEFLIVSRWTNREAGGELAVRILEAVAGEPFVVEGQQVHITCSVGWAPYPWSRIEPDSLSFEEVLSLADRALYLAKREGRNRTVGVLPGPDNPAGGPVPEGSLKAMEGQLVELVRQQGPDVVPSFAPASPDSSQIRAATRAT